MYDRKSTPELNRPTLTYGRSHSYHLKAPYVMLQFNAPVNLPELTGEFALAGRVSLIDFLETNDANGLLDHLHNDMQWSTVLVKGDRMCELTSESRQRMASEQQLEVLEEAYEAARKGFSFCYDSNSRAARQNTPEDRLHSFRTLLNSETCLQMLRAITGNLSLSWANAQASRFCPGHFLTTHDDGGSPREIGYVFQLTTNWEASWGGNLHFMNPLGEVVQTLVPRFNSLLLFRVPQPHAVSIIAPYALRARYSISGWLHSKLPSGP